MVEYGWLAAPWRYKNYYSLTEHFWFTLNKSHPASKYLSQEMLLEDCLLPSKISQDAQSLNGTFCHLYTKSRSQVFASLQSSTVLNNEQLPEAMAQAYLWSCICLIIISALWPSLTRQVQINPQGLKPSYNKLFSLVTCQQHLFFFFFFLLFWCTLFFLIKTNQAIDIQWLYFCLSLTIISVNITWCSTDSRVEKHVGKKHVAQYS